jgi:hypothetical protein
VTHADIEILRLPWSGEDEEGEEAEDALAGGADGEPEPEDA